MSEALIPSARFFRQRIVSDWIRVDSPQTASSILNFDSCLAVIPVTTLASQMVVLYTPNTLSFLPINSSTLTEFSFSLTNSMDQSVAFIANTPSFVLTFIWKAILC